MIRARLVMQYGEGRLVCTRRGRDPFMWVVKGPVSWAEVTREGARELLRGNPFAWAQARLLCLGYARECAPAQPAEEPRVR